MKKLILTSIVLFLGLQGFCQGSIPYPIYFEYKVAAMDTTEEKRLIFFLKNFDSFTIDSVQITGYCDDRGRKIVNDSLSIKRAETIRNLIGRKINYEFPSIISGKGSIELDKKLEIDSQRRLNRRGELIIFYSMTKSKNKVTKPKAKQADTNIMPKSNPADSGSKQINQLLKSVKPGEAVDLKIYFEGSSSIIKKSSGPELISLLQYMKENIDRKIKITGHIYDINAPTEKDAYDTHTKDQKLSINRAKKVHTYLVNNGIDSQRVQYEGMAAKFPRNKDPEGDRRVEIGILE